MSSSSVYSMGYKYLEMCVYHTVLLALLCQQVEQLCPHPVPETFQKIFCEFFLIDLDLIVVKLRLHLTKEPAAIAAIAKQLLATPPSEGCARSRRLYSVCISLNIC